MSQSFTAAKPGTLSQTASGRRTVLVTGAAGNIGSYFAEHAQEKYTLRLMVRASDKGVEAIQSYGEVVTCDLGDLDGLKKVCAGMDAIVHLAGDPDPSATWHDVLEDNIKGTYHLFAAAKEAGCRRVVYASSIHAVSGYAPDVQVKTSEPVNPGDIYGVGKCFGEALARYMAEREGLSAIAIRIGAFQPIEAARQESGVSMLDAFVSQRDLDQLINRCIDVENIQFAILNGVSNNRFKKLDISDARELVGYAPEDDLTQENPKLRELRLNETVKHHNQDDPGREPGIREEVSVSPHSQAGKS